MAGFVRKRKQKTGKHDAKGTAKVLRSIVAKQIKREKKRKDAASKAERPTEQRGDKDRTKFLHFLEDTETYIAAAIDSCTEELYGLRMAALYANFQGKVDLLISGETKTFGGGGE